MMKKIVQLLMLASWAFYAVAILVTWGPEALGESGVVLDLFDFQPGTSPVPWWLLAVGFLLAIGMLVALGLAYRSVWQILGAGELQKFDELGRRLQWMGTGLVALWIFWNLLTGIFQSMLSSYATAESAANFEWNPFDLDIVLLIVGFSIFAIARMMQRAAAAEEENQSFL